MWIVVLVLLQTKYFLSSNNKGKRVKTMRNNKLAQQCFVITSKHVSISAHLHHLFTLHTTQVVFLQLNFSQQQQLFEQVSNSCLKSSSSSSLLSAHFVEIPINHHITPTTNYPSSPSLSHVEAIPHFTLVFGATSFWRFSQPLFTISTTLDILNNFIFFFLLQSTHTRSYSRVSLSFFLLSLCG